MGRHKAFEDAMEAQGWVRLPDGRWQHPDGKEVYTAVAYLLWAKQDHSVDNVVFYAHDIREDEVVTEVIAEEVYGHRGNRVLSSHM